MDNKTMLLILMIVLIVFIVLLTSLAIVFIVALRKRAPVIKVVMAPTASMDEEDDAPEEEPVAEMAETPVSETAVTESAPVHESVHVVPEPESDDDDDDETVFVTEGQERVRYDRSFTAKVCQLRNETKGWYTEIKNELLSYERVRDRMSWRRESFRIGRMTLARLVVRGKTLCLMLAVEPAGYAGTKYTVEDVSGVASTADTPSMYRIKSVRKLKYAKEMVAGLMKELKVYKDSHYEAKDFFMPYEGDMGLMEKGLVKRVVTGSTRVFKIEEVKESGEEEAAITSDVPETDSAAGELPAGENEITAEETAATKQD